MKDLIEKQKRFFDTNQTKSISFRIEQLHKLKKLLMDNEHKLDRAIYDDFRKSAFDNYSCEIAIIYNEIDHAINNVRKWSKLIYVNAGQTCVAPDYVVLPHRLKKRFLELITKEIQKENFSIDNQNYVQIINDNNVKRLSLLSDQEKVVLGGSIVLKN